jgi:hypothetical protein
MAYEVPPQDLRVSLSRMPTYPKSKFIMRRVTRTGDPGIAFHHPPIPEEGHDQLPLGGALPLWGGGLAAGPEQPARRRWFILNSYELIPGFPP